MLGTSGNETARKTALKSLIIAIDFLNFGNEYKIYKANASNRQKNREGPPYLKI